MLLSSPLYLEELHYEFTTFMLLHAFLHVLLSCGSFVYLFILGVGGFVAFTIFYFGAGWWWDICIYGWMGENKNNSLHEYLAT